MPLKAGGCRDVQYRVYRDGGRYCPGIGEADGAPLNTLKPPERTKLDCSSLEVLLRYVLVEVVAA